MNGIAQIRFGQRGAMHGAGERTQEEHARSFIQGGGHARPLSTAATIGIGCRPSDLRKREDQQITGVSEPQNSERKRKNSKGEEPPETQQVP